MVVTRNKVYFDRFSADELVAEFGSPLYVYEYETMVHRYQELRDSFLWKNTKIFYACKANTNLSILRIFKELGSGVDAVSPGEIFYALRAGFQPPDILLTGTNLSKNDIEFALQNNILVNIDNLSMLEHHGSLFRGRDIAVRINPDIRAGGHIYLETGHRESKFGILIDDIPAVKRLCAKHSITVVGLHQHIGSDIVDPDPILQGLENLVRIAREFDTLEFIDIGGGFKVRYHDDEPATDMKYFGNAISERFSSFCREYGRELVLIIEPGKYLTSESGFLLTTVQSVKQNDNKIFVGTDTGMNHLLRPALYHAYHEIINATSVDGKKERVDVVGNICESADVLGKNRKLTLPKVGTVLCIKNAGAYGFSMASNYNARLLPAEILIRDGKASIIRRRQTFEDLLRLDV